MDDQNNPYRAPESKIVDTIGRDLELADYGERFAAALIDGILMMCVLLPAMYFGGYFDAVMAGARTGENPPFTLVAMWGFIGFAILVMVQSYPLNATAQTWGKRILGIRIVDLDGQQPPLSRLIAMRYLPVQAASLIPILGGVLSIVNILLIFRSDRRCGHDLVAGTRVVKAR